MATVSALYIPAEWYMVSETKQLPGAALPMAADIP